MRVLPFFLMVFSVVLLLSACGGGGGNGDSGNTNVSNNTLSTWQPNVFAPASNFAQKCAVPITEISPFNGLPLIATQGSVLDENNWLRSWVNESYLWYDEIVDRDPALFDDPAEYFALLKTEELTASGKAKDQFHFSLSLAGYKERLTAISARYGFFFRILQDSATTEAVILYTEPNSPATQAGLQRGTKILAVDGNNTFTVADIIPDAVNETHDFLVLDVGATTPRTVTLTSAIITSDPVQFVSLLDTATGKVGYLLFNFHNGNAEAELIQAMRDFANAGVNDVVLDLRYNGGGLIDIANRLSYMLADIDHSTQPVFYSQQFNDKNPQLTNHAFIASASTGEALPTLNLPRVFILTSSDTCSASELIINGLRGVDIEVIQIGETTCGKPYGFIDQINCSRVYSSISFRTLNNKQFGDYADGFSPENTMGTAGVRISGCYVEDNDYQHQLSNPQEALLAAVLQYRIDSSCPVISSSAASKKITESVQRALMDSKQDHSFWRYQMR